jgi:hypothetical protein
VDESDPEVCVLRVRDVRDEGEQNEWILARRAWRRLHGLIVCVADMTMTL